MKYIETVEVPIDGPEDYPGNARIHDDEWLDESAETNGQYRSIVARRLDADRLQILAGHGTRAAFRRQGHTSIRVEVIEATETEARRINLVDNPRPGIGGFDDRLLIDLLDAANRDGGLTGTGWDDAAYRELLDDHPNENPYGYSDDDPADEDDSPLVDGAPGVYPDDDVIDAAFQHFRAAGFPYPDVPRYAAMQQINRLARTETSALPNTVAAYHVADPYQPHRFAVAVQERRTPIHVFEMDDTFRHALRLAMEQAGRIYPSSLLAKLALARNSQLAAQFRPGFALAMYRRFAPAGGTVLDTSTGYGGRLTGFLASHCTEYIGVDPNTITTDGNQRLVADLCPPGKRVELHCLPAEDVPHDVVAGRADFAFTSPPYFSKEMYSDEDTQSWKRYPTGDGWRTGFLVPMLALQHAALKPGSVAAINIADVTIRADTYPLVQWTIDAAEEVGFDYEQTEKFALARAPGNGEAAEGHEAVVILRKPAHNPGANLTSP